MLRTLVLTLGIGLFTTTTLADQYVPDRHVITAQNTDYVGGDLRNIFDTTLAACQAACLADNQCVAFTFNQRSNACFPKGSVEGVAQYEGAISGRVIPTDPAVLAYSADRAADLTFLAPGDLKQAYDVALTIGSRHPSNDLSVAELLDASARAFGSRQYTPAYNLLGAAVAVADTSQLWLDLSEMARSHTVGSPALYAAINGYLRALDTDSQATALIEVANALEAQSQGRTMIAALRLAQDIAPRRDVEAALERAIGLYGFRVAETQVDSDNSDPRLCVIFTEPLVRAGVDYAPFVQVADVDVSVEVSASQLCMTGVEHGQRYRIVLRPGLPAASGETLVRPVELNLYVRDRTPAARFTSRAYVLPRLGDAALPIETVNLDTLDLKLSRISDRNIVRAMQEGLFAQPLYEYDDYYFSDQIAENIWEGTATVANELNQDMLTRLPLDAALSGQPAGVYVLSAAIPGVDPYETAAATQWFILSDLGVATMMGTDGLTVVIRSLGDATPTVGAEVTLLSRANAILGVTSTGPDGIARFEPGLTRGVGSAAPALVTVTMGQDLAFLSLSDPAFDLSDRGVEGREPAGPIDVFLTPDRGAYHAGETIYLTALMRDDRAIALPAVPLTAILYRPDGVEYSRITSTNDSAGGHVFALPVASTAPRGTWSVSVYTDVDGPSLASVAMLVEDFLPERIDFALTLPETVQLGDALLLQVAAKYLFGPPAGDLPIEGEVLVTAVNTLDQFPGFQFGRYDEPFETSVSSLESGSRTDADGTATVPVTLPALDAPLAQPLGVTVITRLAEGSGRPVERRASTIVLPELPMIGIRPAFDGYVSEGADATFQLIGLAPDLSAMPMEVTWTVNRIDQDYQWYQLYGSWNWEPITRRSRVATGVTTLGAEPIMVSAPVTWGQHEIIVERNGAEYAASSTSFYAGWYAPADAGATPDLLEASLDAQSYAIGDTATFRIVPRYAGTAVITVMSNHIIAMQTVQVTMGENLIELPVTDEWGAGAYVTASVIRPMDVAENRNPTRSLGLTYAPVDPGIKALDVTLDTPDIVQPRGALDVGITVAGVQPGDLAYVTLAAVDVGILNLTAFQSPDPQGYYFGQRKLGMELRDVYGRLIDGMNGAMGTVRSGGDAMAQMGQQSPPPTEELVAFFQGPVAIGPDGTAMISFDLPAFNGTVRLMAVAWSATGVGQATDEVLVRDPVVVTASLPRFMAPGDTSRLLLEIVHADGPAGDMALRVIGDGLAIDASSVPATITLAAGGKQTLSIPFGAADVGVQQITVTLTTPDGRELAKVLTVPVMANDPEVSRMSRFTLAAGQTFTFDDAVFAGLVAGSGSSTLSVGSLARFDAPGLLNALDRYPYGCTEQITSKAMPLLYFDEVATAMGLAHGDQIGQRIDQAITEVLGNQDASGAFGLWYPASGDLWLDSYVTDFLSRARARGHAVPDLAFRNALDNLRNRVNYAPDFETGGEDIAYALMVLSREGEAAVGDLRYYADERPGTFTTPLAAAQLGAALAFYGDQVRADAMFGRASDMLRVLQSDITQSIWRVDYGTNRRDAAAVLTLAVEAGSNAVDREALAVRISGAGEQSSTQEAAWALMAANALIDDLRQTGVTVDGQVPEGPLVRVRQAQVATAPVSIANTGDRPTEITVTTFGVPADPEPAGGNGFAIKREWFALDGTPVNPASVALGTRIVAVLTVQPFGRQEGRLMVSDPLPAGFEIDNPNLIRGGDLASLPWLEVSPAQNAEFRADRFLAAVDHFGDAPFRLAYIVRAVSPGVFHLPAASVEDMYRPQMRARTDAGSVTVTQ